MKKFIISISCDSKSGLHGVREKLRSASSFVEVEKYHNEYAALLNILNSYKNGENLYFWKTYPKPIKLLEVNPGEARMNIENGDVVTWLKNIPYTHCYYIDKNKLYITDGFVQQVAVVVPYKTSIYSVVVDIDTLDPKFISKKIHTKLVNNIENIISMYNDENGLTSSKECHHVSSRIRIPNEVIDYNKFNYDNGMVRGDSHKFKEKENFLHIDLVVN